MILDNQNNDSSIADALREWSSKEPFGEASIQVTTLKQAADARNRRSRHVLIFGSGALCTACLTILLIMRASVLSHSVPVPHEQGPIAGRSQANDGPFVDPKESLASLADHNEELGIKLEQIREELQRIQADRNSPNLASQVALTKKEHFYEQAIDQWLANNE